MSTPLEDRALWKRYWQAKDQAKAQGFCWPCAHAVAFASVDTATTGEVAFPKLCGRCERKGQHSSEGSASCR